ncbi:Hypothetical predicted protein [Octopus vulgaris]|uniref:Retrotransposon gag domain-containing protein n=1 Tax=Octopus vulgaris TaxID=6645 RepID=A0AA36FGD4_OCTVU|nr:Hypothetical predicted protein [Octopus vulgaris]
MENLPHPKDLDFNQENLAAAWKNWKKEFNLFLIATESDMKPDKVKTSMFLTCIGSKGRDIHSTLDFDSPDEEMNLQAVIEKFDAYCEPRKNITFLRHKFFTCGQAEHQKFDEYVVELRQKAQQCEFGNLTDSLTKDILICGIRDMRLRERLLREPNLDLQKTIQAGQSAEQTRLQSRMLNATSETRDNEISRVYSQHDRKGAKTRITRHMQSRHQKAEVTESPRSFKRQVNTTSLTVTIVVIITKEINAQHFTRHVKNARNKDTMQKCANQENLYIK